MKLQYKRIKKSTSLFLLMFSPLIFFCQVISLDWAKQLNDQASIRNVKTDKSGNIYTIGHFRGTLFWGSNSISSGGGRLHTDIFITKMDSLGNYLWAKKIGTGSVTGTQYQIGRSIDLDSHGNIYITGNYESTVDFDPLPIVSHQLTSNGGYDVFMAKYDSSGSFVWVKSIGSVGTDVSSTIHLDQNDDIIIVGSFSGTVDFDPGPSNYFSTANTNNVRNFFICKYSNLGSFKWMKKIEGINSLGGKGIESDVTNNIYFTGNYYGTVDFDPDSSNTSYLTSLGSSAGYLCKLDSNGNFKWVNNLDGPGSATIVSILVNNNEILLGGNFVDSIDFNPDTTTNHYLNTIGINQNCFISKLDTSRNFIWVKHFSSFADSYMGDLSIDQYDNVYSTGEFGSNMDFDPNVGVFNLNASGSNNCFVSRLDKNGNFNWALQFGSVWQDGGRFIDIVNDNIYLTGVFAGTVDFDPSASVFSLTSNNSNRNQKDAFFLKMHEQSLNIYENQGAQIINIYPNPSKSNVFIRSSIEINEYEIYNLKGQLIITGKGKVVNVTNLSNNMYILKVRTLTTEKVFKLFKN